jgi:hypothetical protein
VTRTWRLLATQKLIRLLDDSASPISLQSSLTSTCWHPLSCGSSPKICPEIALKYFFEKMWFYMKYIVRNRRWRILVSMDCICLLLKYLTFQFFWFWAYLMMVITVKHRGNLICYQRFYYLSTLVTAKVSL